MYIGNCRELTISTRASLGPRLESELDGDNRMFAIEDKVGDQPVIEALTATGCRTIESERLTVSPFSRLSRLTPAWHKVCASQR
jgi:hypothetical protein